MRQQLTLPSYSSETSLYPRYVSAFLFVDSLVVLVSFPRSPALLPILLFFVRAVRRVRRPSSVWCIPCARRLLPLPFCPAETMDLMRVCGTSMVSLGRWWWLRCPEPFRALPHSLCLLSWLAPSCDGCGLDARQRYFHGRSRRVGLVASVGNVPVLLHPRCRQFERVGVMALLAFFLYPFIWRCRRPRCALRDELRLCW